MRQRKSSFFFKFNRNISQPCWYLMVSLFQVALIFLLISVKTIFQVTGGILSVFYPSSFFPSLYTFVKNLRSSLSRSMTRIRWKAKVPSLQTMPSTTWRRYLFSSVISCSSVLLLVCFERFCWWSLLECCARSRKNSLFIFWILYVINLEIFVLAYSFFIGTFSFFRCAQTTALFVTLSEDTQISSHCTMI